MSLALHVPGSVEGWMRRRDARWKLAGVLAAGAMLAVLRDPGVILLAALATLLLAFASHVSLRWLVQRLAPVVGLFLLFFGWIVFVPVEGESMWPIGPVGVAPSAAAWLVRVLGKTLTLLILGLTLLETTPLHELGQAAAALGMPGRLVHLVLLTHRYVFLIAEEFGRMRVALRVRGFRSGANRHTYRTIGHVAGTLLVRGHDRAERVYQAMACRGFDGRFRTLHSPCTSLADVALFVSLTAAAAGLGIWDRGWLP